MDDTIKKPRKRKKLSVPVIKEKKASGRPTDYTDEIAAWVCEIVAITPKGINRICEMYEGFPSQPTIDRWRRNNERFRLEYARAKVFQANLLAEDVLEVAQNRNNDFIPNEDGMMIPCPSAIARDNLIIQTQKWIASKLVPKIYGKDVELQQKTEENMLLKAEIDALRKRLDNEYQKDY